MQTADVVWVGGKRLWKARAWAKHPKIILAQEFGV
jgi:hypothetical protein